MRDLVDNFNHNSSSIHTIYFSNNDSLHNQYFRDWYFGSTVGWLNLQYSSYLRVSWLIWDRVIFNSSWEAVGGWYVIYPLVWFVDNLNGWITFQYFMDWDSDSYPYLENFNVASRAWFTHTFWDWTSCLMDKVYFNAWSIIFMCSDSYRTYQILAWSYTLWNHILYVDPKNESNNVWWIWFEEWKARSQTVSQAVRSQILYWGFEINESFITALFSSWYNSYTITPWWSNFWPTCWLYECWTQSFSNSDVGFIYSRDLETIDPDFWGSNTGDSNTWTWVILSWSISQKKSLEEYNSCIDRYIGVSDISKAMYACRSDYDNWRVTREQFLSMQNYVLDLSSNTAYTGETVTDSCFLMVDMALNQFDVHSWTYNTDINLAFRWSTSSNGLDLTYMCWSRPQIEPTSNPSNWWQDILDSLWVGASSTGSWTVIDSVFTRLKNLVSSPIDTYVINPITSEYNSWYNVLNSSSCVVNNSSFAYGDYILYFGVVLIFIVLFGLFF